MNITKSFQMALAPACYDKCCYVHKKDQAQTHTPAIICMVCLHLFMCVIFPLEWMHGVSTSEELQEALFDVIDIRSTIRSWSAEWIQSINYTLSITIKVTMYEVAILSSTWKVTNTLLDLLNKRSSRKHFANTLLAKEADLEHSTEATLTSLCDVTRLNVTEFLTAKDLNTCGMVNSLWQNRFGDSAELVWQSIFRRDFGVPAEMNGMVYTSLPLRQYYFQHILSRSIERAQVYSKHEERKCIVVYNQVFDITEFIELHPGGHQVLEDVIGRDATARWEGAQHSEDAMFMLTKYAIPDVATFVRTEGNLSRVLTRWKRAKWVLQHTSPSGPIRDVALRFLYR
uniref:Cytochrome b5 reductase with Fbox domain putative n=1 Tax=Albugo laibachii Nc14 TaxID=890382 RepID=F0WJD1_9STRA|nr:cytochrome b5 reductase with Fbox domain putative [Albugo laibachii Nc14]|eukprot:CCA21378.1 cytochrome b5 reductase with Fbox domain putative [Albugo laibachii Nc14]